MDSYRDFYEHDAAMKLYKDGINAFSKLNLSEPKLKP